MLVLAATSTCGICEDNYSTKDCIPAVIPCGHVFCRACLAAFDPSRCPICRALYDPDRVHDLDYEFQASPSRPDAAKRLPALPVEQEVARDLTRRLRKYKNDERRAAATLDLTEDFLINHLLTEFPKLCHSANEVELNCGGRQHRQQGKSSASSWKLALHLDTTRKSKPNRPTAGCWNSRSRPENLQPRPQTVRELSNETYGFDGPITVVRREDPHHSISRPEDPQPRLVHFPETLALLAETRRHRSRR